MTNSRREFLQTTLLGLSAGTALLRTQSASAQPAVAPSPEGSGLKPGYALVPVASASITVPNYLRRSTYIPLITTQIGVIRKTGGNVALRLIEVNYIPYAPQSKWLLTTEQTAGAPSTGASSAVVSDTDSFALVFTGPRGMPVRQSTYTVWHPSIGKFLLFLVPIGIGKKGIYYEAVINRSNV